MITAITIAKELDALRTEIELGQEMDKHEWSRLLERLSCELDELNTDIARTEMDLRDECREAYGWQEQYQEQLEHAERHIEWLEHEFADEIVAVDKYERSC